MVRFGVGLIFASMGFGLMPFFLPAVGFYFILVAHFSLYVGLMIATVTDRRNCFRFNWGRLGWAFLIWLYLALTGGIAAGAQAMAGRYG